MIANNKKQDCCGCHACYSICPEKCISMIEDVEGFLYPKIDTNRCIKCNLCERTCPSLHPFLASRPITSYACKHKDIKIRKISSSGGMFSAIAKYVISKNGIVFGSETNEKHECIFNYTDTEEGYKNFRGSKYVQSILGDVLIQAKGFLENGKIVLFTGCPCQISALRHFLGKDYHNLICVDFICHGVPSYKVLLSYINRLEDKYKQRVVTIKYRVKNKYWQKLPLFFKLENNKTYTLHHAGYMEGFFQNLYLRPSCYNCFSNGFKSGSDITIADYWGIESKFPAFDDGLGVSLVLINSIKGKKIFNSLKDQLMTVKSNFVHPFKYQPHLFKSASKNQHRKLFFKDLLKGEDFSLLEMKYIKSNYIYKLKRLLGHKTIFYITKIIYISEFLLKEKIGIWAMRKR